MAQLGIFQEGFVVGGAVGILGVGGVASLAVMSSARFATTNAVARYSRKFGEACRQTKVVLDGNEYIVSND